LSREQSLVVAIRALVWLALISVSVGLFVLQLHAPPHGWVDAWRTNRLLLANRLPILLVIGIAGAGSLVSVALYLRRHGLERAATLHRLARILSPLALLGLLPGVANHATWDNPLQVCLVSAGFVILCEALTRTSLGAWYEPDGTAAAPLRKHTLPPSLAGRVWPILVALGVVAYAGYMCHFTVINHRAFNTSSFDLGIYDNQFWQALHGHPFRSTPVLRNEGNWSVLKTHAELGMYVLLPFYALRPRAETLLSIQSIVLAIGAVPVYRFAARRLSRPIGCLLAWSYLIYPPLHGANLYDFHFQPIAAVCVLWAIALLDEGRRIGFGIAFALALSCREDIALMTFAYGGFLVVSGERPRDGAIIASLSLLYFALVKFAVMPLFGSWWFAEMYKDLYPPDAQGYGGILQTLLANPTYVLRTLLVPDKLRYVLQLFVSLAFLPLRRLHLWLLLFPGAFLTLLTTRYPATLGISFQYPSYWFALAFPATVYALVMLRDADEGLIRMRSALVALGVGSLLMSVHFGAIPPRARVGAGFGLARFTALTQADIEKEKNLKELMAMVPPEARIAVSENELPHVSGRAECYSLKYGAADADYVLYANGSQGEKEGQAELRMGRMKIVATRPGMFLLQSTPHH